MSERIYEHNTMEFEVKLHTRFTVMIQIANTRCQDQSFLWMKLCLGTNLNNTRNILWMKQPMDKIATRTDLL